MKLNIGEYILISDSRFSVWGYYLLGRKCDNVKGKKKVNLFFIILCIEVVIGVSNFYICFLFIL